MNRPEDLPIDIEEIRAWANAERERHAYSWSRFASLTGVPAGTIQPFCKGNYPGETGNARVARELFKYRQTVETQRDREVGIPVDPGFIETPSARRILTLLTIAQRGRITIAATAPGVGKTMAVEYYAACNTPVWVATMDEATKRMNAMLWEVCKAVGEPLKYQWSHGASRIIMDAVRGRKGLLIIDEANHLEFAALEQLRAIHDKTGVGICLLGNEELLMRMRNGLRRDQFARLNSRVAMSHIQDSPTEEDVAAFCDGWQIDQAAMRKMLVNVALTPGAGGLRECAMIIESAGMLAIDDGQPLSLGHLRDAHSMRATRVLRA